MGKARTDRFGHTREQKLQKENDKLKRQISSLRKTIARLDLDRYDTIKELIESHYQEEKAEEGRQILETLKQTWTCHKCQDGHLEIFIYTRGGETFYYRICSNAPGCMNRTNAKKYDPKSVKGIVRKDKFSQEE